VQHEHVLDVAMCPDDAVAGVDLRLAQRLPAGVAVAAVSAGETEPRDGNPVAHADLIADARPERLPLSWPGISGSGGLIGQSPCAAWMSGMHRPQASIRTSTWPSPASGLGTSSILSGRVKS
jgi:hypothetical protein